MIAALFVLSDGPYANVDGIDAYDIERDAKTYKGPHKVIAHPPCQLWGKFAKINYKRWGGKHNKPGNDGGIFLFALNCVRKYGGVLEHPAYSYAYQHYNIQKPAKKGWNKIGKKEWVCEVWQSAYGHRATKKTWLLFVGENTPMELNWDRVKGSHQIGFYDQRGKAKNKPTLSKRESCETPVLFRDALIKLINDN